LLHTERQTVLSGASNTIEKNTLFSLKKLEVKAFFMRRTKLIQLIEKRIEEMGEEKVLFE